MSTTDNSGAMFRSDNAVDEPPGPPPIIATSNAPAIRVEAPQETQASEEPGVLLPVSRLRA
jgi:hypothetical protein